MSSIGHVKKFVNFAAKELSLNSLPKINFVGNSENKKDAFGHFFGRRNGSTITIRITGRHPIDIMRTVAHELIHYKQRLLKSSSPDKIKEDEANALAGRIMRKFDSKYPHVFRDLPIPIKEDGTTSAVPANSMGGSSSTSGPIQTYDPLLGINKKDQMLKRKQLQDITKTKPLAQLRRPI